METKRENYAFGAILFILAAIVFTSLIYQIIGWYSIIIGPIVALMACRPSQYVENGPWIWERDVAIKNNPQKD